MAAQMNVGPRLTRSMKNRRWFGVAAGMAEYLNVEVSLIRLIWVVAAIVTGGAALLIYLAAAVIIPRENEGAETPEASVSTEEYTARRRRFWGTVLVAFGALVLLANLGPWHWVEWNIIWPLILVALGVALLVQRSGSRPW